MLKENAQSIDFDDFTEVLDRNGWSYSNYYDVTGKDGRTGTRYELEQYWENPNGIKPVPYEELEADLKNTFGDNVTFAQGTHRYAPEIRKYSVVVFD